MNSSDAARNLVAQLRSMIGEINITLHRVRFAPDLYDVHVSYDDWTLILSLSREADSVRLILDDYVVDNLVRSAAIDFIRALVDGKATVRIAGSRLLGKYVVLSTDATPGLTLTRRLRSGLADWEARLQRPSAETR